MERYLDAHALTEARLPHPDRAVTGGPLPWLPPPPPDDGELADYVQQRADLVHTLATTITANHLPDTAWADQLRQAAPPDLARRLAVWRAATGAADHPHPVGPHTSPTPEVRSQWQTLLATDLPDHDNEALDRQLETQPSHVRHGGTLRAAARHDRRARSISR
ncbi:hypothetical protein SAMN05661080_03946 [Modestobacter sp. DSM 44400]|uniref:hypothetical protein n=1 Tax=Modestobacter sp. DSM 44400 TaxID=1550230 RepID=UPI00089C5838|nr:hypothetical protein [Modestobacter sp. DSM 44400]SDY58807.1 hypothetical protein SAMN05661080_03946 [Modestobacter sp. DSM 44400]